MTTETAPTKRGRGRPRRTTPPPIKNRKMGRPRKPLSPVDQVKPSKIVFASRAIERFVYSKYAEHCGACLKLKITPTPFDEWAVDYQKDGILKHHNEKWNAGNRGEGLHFQQLEQYRAGIEGARR